MNLKLLSLPTPGRRRFTLNLVGVVILGAGLSTAASIWLTQDRIERQRSAGDSSMTGPLAPEDSRRYTRDVEIYYGETGLLMEKWRRWLEEWTQGKPLAEVIAVASLILAGGLFYAEANRSRKTRLPTPGTPQGPPGNR